VEFNKKENWLHCLSQIICTPAALGACVHLFPRSLEHCNPTDVTNAISFLRESLEESPAETAERYGISFDEIVRLFLVLQHNGFESGLYRYLTILNHSCQPNSIKYAPTSASYGASEVWTIERIEKGQELLICYAEPSGQNPLTVREYLQKNHSFKCSCRYCSISFSCSVSSIETVLATKLYEWQFKIERLERRYQYYHKLVTSLFSKLRDGSVASQELVGTQLPASLEEVVLLSERLKTSIVRILKVRDDMRESRSIINPWITMFMYRRVLDSLRAFVDLYLEFGTHHYVHIITEIKRVGLICIGEQVEFGGLNAVRALMKQLLENIMRSFILSMEIGTEDVTLVCCGFAHPLIATALLDLSSTMDKLVSFCRKNAASLDQFFDRETLAVKHVKDDRPVDLMMAKIADLFEDAGNSSWTESTGSFQSRQSYVREVGETVRKLFVTSRHYPGAVRLMSQGGPGTAFWANRIPPTTFSSQSDPTMAAVQDIFCGVRWIDNCVEGTADVVASDFEEMTVAEWVDSLNMLIGEIDEEPEEDPSDDDA
jgi:hypothetical protein